MSGSVGEQDFAAWLAGELPWLQRFATVMCGRDLADDIVHDVAIKVQRRWTALREVEHPRGYVRRMVVNEYLSWRRRWSRITPVAELVDRPDDQLPHEDRHALRTVLKAAVIELPPRQRAAIVLRYYEDLPDDEIAEAMDCATSTVRSTISRALAALRGQLDLTEQESSHAH